MIRDIFHSIGIGCILAGGIMYFTDGSDHVSIDKTQQLQEQVDKLQSELAKTKEELAIAQTTSSVQDTVPNKTDQTIKSVLTIEAGSNSTIVATELERLGIIDNVSAFDNYLVVQHSLGQELREGTRIKQVLFR